MTDETPKNDDGLPWGFMVGEVWHGVPKVPLLGAHLGPPPFDVVLPSGQTRRIVHRPSALEDAGQRPQGVDQGGLALDLAAKPGLSGHTAHDGSETP